MVTHAVQLSGPGTEPAVAADDADPPIGRALPHVCDHVTDEGELLVAGDALATGYLGRPELTTSAFPVIDHGCGPVRWFRTGDLVRRGADGLLYSRGRTDEQVKVLGVRVHPAEVEAHLNAHPAVKSSVVIAERSLGRTALVAYVVPNEAIAAGELRRHLHARLPSQLVPSKVTFVAELAYTASGKVDRAAVRLAAAGIANNNPENTLGNKGAAR
jgi:acyl-coenzyme A synthetase/AMP-(fatty) acid ligase